LIENCGYFKIFFDFFSIILNGHGEMEGKKVSEPGFTVLRDYQDYQFSRFGQTAEKYYLSRNLSGFS